LWYKTLHIYFRIVWTSIGKSEGKLKCKRTCDDNIEMEHKWKKDAMTKTIKMKRVKTHYQDAILSSLHPGLFIYFALFQYSYFCWSIWRKI